MMMFNREPILPFDIKYNLDKNEKCDGHQEPFGFSILDAFFSSETKPRSFISDNASEKTKKAQEKQKQTFDRRHLLKTEICVAHTHTKKQQVI